MENILRPIHLFQILSVTAIAVFVTTKIHAASASRPTQAFINAVAVDNEFEIESGRLALEKSQYESVRHFAQQMIDDHTAAGRRMDETLRGENLSDLTPAGLDETHRITMEKLSADAPEKFDRDYIRSQRAAHDEAVSLFEKYSTRGDDPGLKILANEMIPALAEHEDLVADLRKNYKKSIATADEGIAANALAPAAGGPDPAK